MKLLEALPIVTEEQDIGVLVVDRVWSRGVWGENRELEQEQEFPDNQEQEWEQEKMQEALLCFLTRATQGLIK